MYNVAMRHVRLIFVPPDYPKSLISLHSKRELFFYVFVLPATTKVMFSFELPDAFSLFNQILTPQYQM